MTGPGLFGKIRAVHAALSGARIGHAFGGALALAWCTGEVRATIDIDCNIFLGTDRIDEALAAMPAPVGCSADARAALQRDGQARLRWGDTPIDVFFNTTAFHEEASGRVRWHELDDTPLPFLSCGDLAVFKVFSDRGKDWVDLEGMVAAGHTDWTRTLGVLVSHLGSADGRIARLERLLAAR